MVRSRTRQPEAPTGFVASAVRLPAVNKNEAGKTEGWQNQAWKHYDNVGELRYLANWMGNVLSRAELHAAKREGNTLAPLTEGPARDAMDELYGGPQGQSQMLQLLGVNTTVSGEGYVSARSVSNEDKWDVLSTGKVTQTTGGKLKADFGEGKQDVPSSDLIIRVWTPHPTEPSRADAPTRSNLKTLSQVVGYDDHISAQLTSRLAGAGVLVLPSEIQFAAANEADDGASEADSFMQSLAEAMQAAITDRNSPASFVPIVVTAPGEYIEAIKHLTFWSELDDSVIGMREAAIKRFAIGMDVPPEVLMGNAEANHWNAWLSEESAIKAHLEPRLNVINHALTTAYLRPALKGVVPDAELGDYYVIANTTNIRVRPNKSEQSMELHDRGMIGQEAVLRETGFRPEDQMEADEFKRWLLYRVSNGATTPELAVEALRLLGLDINPAVVVGDDPQGQPTQTKPDTEIADPADGAPELDPDQPLVAACEVLVWRALERAGNKLKNQHPRTDVTAMRASAIYMTLAGEPDHLLAGAWDCAEEVLSSYDVDQNEVAGVLDFYVRGLITRKQPYSRATLSRLLKASHLEALGNTA